MQLSRKQQKLSQFSFPFRKSRFNFEHSQKKRWPSSLMYFWTYGLRKMWLDKCLKSTFSEDPSKSNMVNEPKHCWNLNDSTFTIYNWSMWRQFSWKKSLLVICKILGLFVNTLIPDHKYSLLLRDNLSNIFKSNHLGNNRHFREFFLYLGNLDSILKNFKKEVTLIADVFLNLSTPKKVVR